MSRTIAQDALARLTQRTTERLRIENEATRNGARLVGWQRLSNGNVKLRVMVSARRSRL